MNDDENTKQADDENKTKDDKEDDKDDSNKEAKSTAKKGKTQNSGQAASPQDAEENDKDDSKDQIDEPDGEDKESAEKDNDAMAKSPLKRKATPRDAPNQEAGGDGIKLSDVFLNMNLNHYGRPIPAHFSLQFFNT